MSYLHLPGVAGEYASTPDAAALDIVGDIWLAGKFALLDWTPAADTTLIAKWEDTGDERSYRFMVDTTGVLRMSWSTDGAAGTVVLSDSTVAPTVSDEAELWVAGTLDVSSGDVKFYSGGTGATPTWAQLGSTVAGAGATSIYSGTGVLEVGTDNTGTAQLLTGEVYNAQVENGYDEGVGTLVFDADFTNRTQSEVEATTFTEDSAQAATVTLNGDEWAYVEPHVGGVLGRCELLLRADNKFAKGSPKWPDLSGNNHHGQHGSAAGADTNDPLFLPWTGLQYMYLPGIVLNYASTPDTAALSIAGDIDLRVDCALPDWSPSASTGLVGKYDGNGSQRAYLFYLNSSGFPSIITSTLGSNDVINTSTVQIASAANTRQWVRATLDLDDGAGNRVAVFYTSSDSGATWDVLDTVTTAGATTMFDSTAVVEIGSFNIGASGLASGDFYQAQIYDGIDGTLVFDADFTDAAALTEPFATFVEKSSNGATVTINRAASGRVSTVVDKAMFLLGTDDYFEIADHADLDFATGDDFTVMVAGRVATNPDANHALVAKSAGVGNQGWNIYMATNRDTIFRLDDTVADELDAITGPALGTAFVAGGRRDAVANEVEVFLDGTGSGSPTVDATTLTLANADALRIGRHTGAGTGYFDGEIHAVALFREALSDADVAAAGVELTVTGAGAMMLLGVGA